MLILRICTVAAARGRGSADRDDGPGRDCDNHVGAAKGGRLAAPKADTDMAFLGTWELFGSFGGGQGQCVTLQPDSPFLWGVLCSARGSWGTRTGVFSPSPIIKNNKNRLLSFKRRIFPKSLFVVHLFSG